ncbi:MAG: HAMP domain-containing protein, partial [Actinobacteria bacterium]|nr:HAMP domain-containing protein [Actinomycetota bacterium]
MTVLLLVVGTAAWSIGLVITRPLARLTEAARTVAEGDLSVDLPVAGRDEVSYLTGVFNGMVA